MLYQDIAVQSFTLHCPQHVGARRQILGEMHMEKDGFACLNCGFRTTVYNKYGVEIDECEKCGAYWFDGGELQAILHQEGVDLDMAGLRSGLRLPNECRWCAKENPEGTLDCALCHRRLGHQCPRDGRGMLLSTSGNVTVDVCPSCMGVWFDGDEFEQLLHEKKRLASLLRMPTPQEENPKVSAYTRARRPKGMPDELDTPTGFPLCQICGETSGSMGDLNWDRGLLKCDDCLRKIVENVAEQERLERLRTRNEGRLQQTSSEQRPAWLQSISGFFARKR